MADKTGDALKKKLNRIKVGLNCIIHVRSPILEEYFNEFGNPIKKEDMHKACFEGKVVMLSKVPTPLDVNKSKTGWAIRIPALSKATRPIYAVASQIDQYFCADFEEPNGWKIVDKNEMETFHQIFVLLGSQH